PLSRAGRPADALALAERAVRTAESLDYPPVLAEALLERGRAGIHNNEAWQVRGPLQRALVLAVGSRADDVAAEAAVFQLYARTVSNDIHAAAADLPLTEALVARAPSAARLRGELLHNAAVLALAQGEPERARALYHAALQAKQEAHGSDALEIAYTLANRAMVAVDPHAQEEDLRRAIAIFEHNLGAVHPEAIAARIIAGNYTDDPHEALEILQPACDALKRLAADPLEQRGICLARVSQQYAELDLPEEERAFLRQAADAIRATASADTEEKKVILGLAAATEGGDLQLEAELRRYARGLPTKTWWQRRNRGDVHYALAALLRARGDLPGAADMIARAVEDFLAGAEDVQDIAYHQRLHRARIILAELSLAAGPLSGERVVQLARHLDAALQWYADRGDTYEWRRERIRELQRELARRSGALEAPARD
ncbi:MAG TPA: tetratricopeptide repeat protein, partial [Nannocystis sp.]